jgi:hypothetical protein
MFIAVSCSGVARVLHDMSGCFARFSLGRINRNRSKATSQLAGRMTSHKLVRRVASIQSSIGGACDSSSGISTYATIKDVN